MEQGKKYPKINASALDTDEDFQSSVTEACLKVITAEFACCLCSARTLPEARSIVLPSAPYWEIITHVTKA